MRTVDLIQRKRNGEELSPEEITWLVESYTRGEIPDYQMSAFLMAVYFENMTDYEVGAMVDAIIASGGKLDLSDVQGPKVEKHSTGGVGDKTSLIAAPLAAAAGVKVPMISGRALGHTGGTLDKLESVIGLRTDLSLSSMQSLMSEHHLFMAGQTPTLVPADRIMYALRDVTGTVENVGLITASMFERFRWHIVTVAIAICGFAVVFNELNVGVLMAALCWMLPVLLNSQAKEPLAFLHRRSSIDRRRVAPATR